MEPFSRIFVDENFSSVDPTLTPDPFGTVTTAGGNVADAGAYGVASATAMKVNFNGTSSSCFGAHTLVSNILAARGIAKFGLQGKVIDSGLAAGQALGLMIIRNGGTDLIRVFWVTDVDTAKGFLRISAEYGTPGNVETGLIDEDDYFDLEYCILATGELQVLLNGTEVGIYNPGTRPLDPGIVRIGTSIADATPSSSGEYVITRFYATQWYHTLENPPINKNEGSNIVSGAILCGAPGGVF